MKAWQRLLARAAATLGIYFTGRNFGNVYSGKSSKTTSTAMPI